MAAGQADVRLRFVADESALAAAERRIEALTNRLDAMDRAGQRAGRTANTAGNAATANQRAAGAGPAARGPGAAGAAGTTTPGRQPPMPRTGIGVVDRSITGLQNFSVATVAAGAAVGALGMALKAIVGGIGDRNAKHSDDVSKSAFNMGDLELKLMNQASISKETAQQRIRTVGTVLQKTPSISTLTGGVEMQTWLEGSTLNKTDVESGKMLNVISEGLVTLNAFGKDKGFTSDKESVRTIVGGSQAFGLGNDAAAVKAFSDTVSMGFKVSTMEAQHLPTFIKEASALSAFEVTPQEAMGVFSTMVSSGMPAESAAVAMRNYGTKLADVKPDQERDQALQSLGLTQQDVALTKENDIFQSLAKLRGALAGKSELEQQSAITQIFGGEQFAGVQMMLRDLDKMKAQTEAIKDTSSLQKTIDQSRQHVAFDRTRKGLGKEIADWESGTNIGATWQDVDLVTQERFANQRNQATTPFERSLVSAEETFSDFAVWSSKRMGLNPEDTASGWDAKARERIAERTAVAAERTADAMIEQNRLTAERNRNRNGNVEPVQAP